MKQPLPDARQYAPATQRNRHAILDVLTQYLPNAAKEGVILEIASGTGEHACFFAEHLPHCTWIPSDIHELSLESIEAWRKQVNLANLYPPIMLDVTEHPWSIPSIESGRPLSEQTSQQTSEQNPVPITDSVTPPITAPITAPISGIVNINMIHISPWAACEGLLAGAAQLLPEGGMLYLYGPFMRDGHHTAPSNLAFDQSLRSRNPQWGVRDLDDVTNVAQQHGFSRQAVVAMPANNFSVIFTQTG